MPVLCVPLADLLPLQSPLAVQEVGLLVTDQLRFELLPVLIEMGLALIETTGAGGSDTVTVAVFLSLVPP